MARGGPLAQAGTVSALELALQVTHTERVSTVNSQVELFVVVKERTAPLPGTVGPITGNNNWFN